MTKQEVLSRCAWDEHDFATLTVFSRMFGTNVDVRFRPGFDAGRRISDQMVAAR